MLSTQNMSYLDLLKQCIKEIYVIIESFLSSWPTFCPIVVQELMATNDGVYRSPIGTNNYSEPLKKSRPINIDDCIWLEMPLGYDEYIGMPPMPSITTPQQNPSPLMLQNANLHVGSSVYKVPTLNSHHQGLKNGMLEVLNFTNPPMPNNGMFQMPNVANLLMPNIEIPMPPTIMFHVPSTHKPRLTRTSLSIISKF